MMLARELMSHPLWTIHETDSLEAAARLMLHHEIGSLLVVGDDGHLSGILTESDFMADEHAVPFSAFQLPKLWGEWVDAEGLEAIYAKARSTQVAKVMQRRVHTAKPTDSMESVVHTMLERDIQHVPVVEDGKPVGMIARHDVLRMVAGSRK